MLLFNLMLGTWEEHHRPQWTGITFEEFSNTKNNDNNYTMVTKKRRASHCAETNELAHACVLYFLTRKTPFVSFFAETNEIIMAVSAATSGGKRKLYDSLIVILMRHCYIFTFTISLHPKFREDLPLNFLNLVLIA